MAIADALEIGAAIVITDAVSVVVVDTGGLALVGAASAEAGLNYLADEYIHHLVGIK